MSDKELLIYAGVAIFVLIFIIYPILAKKETEFIEREDRDEKTIQNLKETVLERLKLRYREIGLTESEKLAYQQDITNFLEYDIGIERIDKYPYTDYNGDIIKRNNIYAFLRGYRKFIYAFGNLIEVDSHYRYSILSDTLELVIFFETKYQKKRLHVGNFRCIYLPKSEIYRVLKDYMEHVKTYDRRNLEIESEKIINKYNGEEFKHGDNYDVLQLSQFQIDLLDKLAEKNPDIKFSFVIDNGVARLRFGMTSLHKENVSIEEDILFIIDTIISEFGI